ncbi:glycosyl hydrolase [Streptomyces sp. DG2A-72]|uniref:glycoside hydrolase family 26 protein n=1 Tax=Streptomyces sp. DG2A-72 TaxID=3051386 RepID=UPI00265C4E5D|nr:glycosyl hydrolase [Streptomyces sp. DG2A-72]MDO0933283.1 glycosyl hydrolase [Streptomyces sp. DG2A-72]
MALERPRAVGRWLMVIAAGTAAAVASVALSTSPPPVETQHSPPGKASHAPAYGAYVHYDGATAVALMNDLSKWLNGYELRVARTYLPGDLWSNIEGAHGFLDKWAEWRRAKDDRLFALNVPMQERNEEGLSDAEVRQLLRRGAAGEFDKHFKVLATRLVELGVPDTILVLGWEMNGISYTHRCGPDPVSWKAYWRRIVRVMRSVPEQKFRFDFTPNRGMDDIPWTACYPGDNFVDIIGMDSYDQPEGMSFDEEISEPYGLQHQVDFAKAHGKEISYPEWGLYRNGDNATYTLRMLAWMDQHKPLYGTFFDKCPHGMWQCPDNPYSAALVRVWLAAQTDPRQGSPIVTWPTPPPDG